ncbi:MAG: BsuPI-related putative proteinase inhibitor [Gemmatimonadota bacterium]
MPETPAAGGADATPEDGAPAAPSDSLRVGIMVPAEVGAGEPVPITLRLENLTDGPLNLYLTGRTIAFDLIVEDEAGAVVWRRLHDQVVPAILRVETLAAGATLELSDTWDQRSNGGAAVGPGTYTVRGEVMTEAQPLVAAPVPLRIGGN